MANDEAQNGLSTFSMHAFDESSAPMIDLLKDEQGAYPAFALTDAQQVADLDPETAARSYLDQALSSTAVPSFTAPTTDGSVSQFQSLGTETVPLTGTTTVKFRQTIDGIPLYGSLITVELDQDNNLVSLSSSLGRPEGVSPVATVSPAEAVATASEHGSYTKELGTVVPRLHYYFDARTSSWRLVYILEDVPVHTEPQPAEAVPPGLEPPRFMDYVVDAHSGRLVAELPRTPSMSAVEQRATDGRGVQRTFLVDKRGDGLVLRDPVHNVETYDFAFGDPVARAGDLPGRAIGKPPEWSPAAVSAHANAVAVAQFLRDVLKRNNIDDRGGAIVSTINCVVADSSPGPDQWHNAFWTPAEGQMVYGQALHDGVLRSLAVNPDVVTHEMIHGVTEHTARLEYARQSGALNESYSDIFGVIATNIGEPDTARWDWEIGEGILPGGRPLRDLSDPPRFRQPAHMRDFRVLPNTQAGDWGGVHINSGIHNKAAFHMLTARAGGRLVLTAKEVAAVFYLALTQHLSRTSQFTDSRRGVVTSARTLFRALAPEEQGRKVGAIVDAFDAVGIA